MFDEYGRELLYFESMETLVRQIVQREKRLVTRIQTSSRESVQGGADASVSILLEACAQLDGFAGLSRQLVEWVLEMDNYEFQFKSTVMNFYRGKLGSGFSFDGKHLENSFRNQTILQSSKGQFYNVYEEYPRDSDESRTQTPSDTVRLDPVTELPVKSVVLAEPVLGRRRQSVGNGTRPGSNTRRISISVNKKQVYKHRVSRRRKSMTCRELQGKNGHSIGEIQVTTVMPQGQGNLIRSRRKALVNQSSQNIDLCHFQPKNRLRPAEDDSESSREDFVLQHEPGLGQSQKTKRSEIFVPSDGSEDSHNIYDLDHSDFADEQRQKKIVKLEKNKLPNIKKDFDFIALMVEASYADYRAHVAGLQEVVFLQTLCRLLSSDTLLERFRPNYAHLLSNEHWLNGLAYFAQHELFFVDNFDTLSEKQLVKSVKAADKWPRQKKVTLRTAPRHAKTAQPASEQRGGFLSSNLRKLTKKASQVVNIQSSEDLSFSDRQLYSESSSSPRPERVVGEERFVCVESFNNFFLLYLKLKHSFALQRHFQRLVVYLEAALYKRERVAYFGGLFSEYSDPDEAPRVRSLGRFFKFEHEFETLCKNKFAKKLEHLVKVIFNSCDVLPKVP